MFNNKTDIFFDLDHTLWDYDQNSTETLDHLYELFSLEKLGLNPVEKFIDSFHKANLMVWDLFDESSLNRQELRNKRLELVFEDFGLAGQPLEGFHEAYYTMCSRKPHLIEGAIEILEFLKPNYQLHIITNGFDDSQNDKLKYSGLKPYFTTVTTSENAGSKKPEKAYFDFALALANVEKENALVIGDGLRTDIRGAFNYGLDLIWLNSSSKICPFAEVVEIKKLNELIGLLN